MKEHLRSAKPLKDDWALPIAVPHATGDQRELLCNAGFLSMGCFSITVTEVLEDTSTIDFHPFQTTCSNIHLTTRTSAILSQQQNALSWRGQAMNFSQMVKKGESRGQKLNPRQQMFTLGKGQRTKYLSRTKHSRPKWLHVKKQYGRTGHSKYILDDLWLPTAVVSPEETTKRSSFFFQIRKV